MIHYSLPVIVVMLAAIVAAVTDVWRFRVYNALTYPLFVCGLLYHAATGGSVGFAGSVLGGCFGLSVLMLPYLMGLLGAGDVKLLAGIGAWLGIPHTAAVFAGSALAAGLYGLVLVAVRGEWIDSLTRIKIVYYRLIAINAELERTDHIEAIAEQSDRRWRLIPFGAMIPLGIVAADIWYRSAH